MSTTMSTAAEMQVNTKVSKRSRLTKWFGAACVLLAEWGERLTFYSVVANCIIFMMNQLEYSVPTCATLVMAFITYVYTIPFLCGLSVEARIGRFWSVCVAFVFYIIGLGLATFLSHDTHGANEWFSLNIRRILYFISLFFIGLGAGLIRLCISPFGALHVDEMGEAAVRIYFKWYYICVNLGAIIAFSAVVYVQQNIGFFEGYLIPAGAITFSAIVFTLPKCCQYYKMGKAKRLNIINMVQMIRYSHQKRKADSSHNNKHMLDYARVSRGGKYEDEQVDSVSSVLKVLPIFHFFIIHWAMYFQTCNTFLVQGAHLNLNLGRDINFPVASMNLCTIFMILLMTPLAQRGFSFLLKRFRKLNDMANHGLKPRLWRIGVGLGCTSLAMVAAGVVEIYRKRDPRPSFTQNIAGKYYNSSQLTIAVQVPQFALCGIGEVFTCITGLQFAFNEASGELKTIVMAIYLAFAALGGVLSMLVIQSSTHLSMAVSGVSWLPDDLNEGHYEYFCFLFAGLGALNLFFFILVSRIYLRNIKIKMQDKSMSIPIEMSNVTTIHENTTMHETTSRSESDLI